MLETPLAFGSTLHAMMIYAPALWVMLGLGIFVVGIFPKAAMFCWAYFIYAFIVGFFGDLLNMPRWAMDLSPFSHIPQLPLEDVRVVTLLILTAVALALTVLGLIFYRRRDVAA
jgi:ABC-2 type transport system permease protein